MIYGAYYKKPGKNRVKSLIFTRFFIFVNY